MISMTSLLEVGLAYVMMKCVDLALAGNMENALSYSLWFALYILVFFLVDHLTTKCKWRVLQIAQSNLRDHVVRQILSMPVFRFHTKNTGDWLSILTNDLNVIEESYFKTSFSLLASSFEFIVSGVLLFCISPLLALFVLVVVALQMVVPKIMSPKISKQKSKQVSYASEFTVTTSEHLNGFDLLKSFHLTANSFQSISSANHCWEDSKYKSRVLSSLANLLSFTFGQFLYVGIYFIGALLTINRVLTVGTMVAASQLVVYLASPLESLSNDITEIGSAKEIVASLNESLSFPKDTQRQMKDIVLPFRELHMRNVSFSYQATRVFDDASMDFKQGRKYLLCGASGTGKSTLVSLLTGAIRPDSGSITVDGTEISQIKPEQYARFILPCSQNSFMFNASLRDNITLFEKHFSDESIVRALESVGFTYVLDRYASDLDEVIDQGGQTLSGGERQRIALARMELFDPPFVVFDESFASLDKEAAQDLIRLVLSAKERTVLMIAHQVSAAIVDYFDEVVSISDKHIVRGELAHD
jgi:ATP-binding cassette subfamily B protein